MSRLARLLMMGSLLLLGEGPAVASELVDYTRQVKPILRGRCYPCHGGLKQKAALRLDTGAAIHQGGEGGPAIEPGKSDESLLVERVLDADPAHRMPPEGAPLTPEQVATLRAWIDQGAKAPATEEPELDPRKHWSFVPPVRQALPSSRDSIPTRNPIDAFLAQECEARGLAPLPPADPHVLLRRIHLDLTGLPPTREQLQAFLADPSDAAYRKVVDQLLASPQYGERWGRHWMDVWRYSDWYGRRAVPDVLNSYAQIWRWRDWIVRSLNEDKGYDRMVQEMLAVDEIAPTDDDNLVATGFIVRNFYRWNYNSWMKDNVEHTGKAFLALTFNCAHCHDHKYDPIKHEDYFALRAIFEPIEIRHDRVAGEPDPGPYPKYTYGAAYKPITSGMVRVFDEKLDAKTFLYTRGESRNIVPDRPPIPPGMPDFLGGKAYQAVPVNLPAEASFPGLKLFVRQEEIKQRETALVTAEQVLAKSHVLVEKAGRELSEAEAAWNPDVPRAFHDPLIGIHAFPTETPPPPEFLKARDAADVARLSLIVDELQHKAAQTELDAIRARIIADDHRSSTEGESTRRLASRVERLATTARTAVELARAERGITLVSTKTAADVKKARDARDKAKNAHDDTLAALGKDSADATPLSPIYPTQSTGRRSGLARWITDRANPLAARVAVNHIWRWHFGSPLVATTHDFGRNGALPTHPELLDWLAVELMEPSEPGVAPWSMKALHRRIVTSDAYCRNSHARSTDAIQARTLDPENRWYWRFPTTRMEAEVVRDSLLHLTGGLDTTIGGPDIDFTQGMTSRRRSLYFTHHGEAKMSFLEVFDAPNACDAYRRTTSVVPQQALAMVNNELLFTLSSELAKRLWSWIEQTDQDGRETRFVRAAFEQILSRPPSSGELEVSERFLAKQGEVIERASQSMPPTSPSDGDPQAKARRDLVHALFSHNDFVTIH